MLEPTVGERAAKRATTRNHDPCTSSSSTLPYSPGSRFGVLDRVPLEHLAEVTSDWDIVLQGKRGPWLEQIAAIRAKESLDRGPCDGLSLGGARVPKGLGQEESMHIEHGSGCGLGDGQVVEPSTTVPPPVRVPRRRPPTRRNPTESHPLVRGSSVGDLSLVADTDVAP